MTMLCERLSAAVTMVIWNVIPVLEDGNTTVLCINDLSFSSENILKMLFATILKIYLRNEVFYGHFLRHYTTFKKIPG